MRRHQRVALVTAIDAEVPATGETSVLETLQASRLFDDIIVALPPGQTFAADFACRRGFEVYEGEADNVALRLLRALGEKPETTTVARFMLRAFWIDLGLVESTLLALEQDDGADYVTYPRNVNYTFGCDAFTKEALRRVHGLTSRMSAGQERSTSEFSPWAMMEVDESFTVTELPYEKTYSVARAEDIRASYAAALGPGENQHGGSSASSPSSRYLWASKHLESGMRVCEIAAGQGGDAVPIALLS